MAQVAALFDIDGTLTSDHVWKGLMEFFKRRGERRLTHWRFLAAHYPLALARRWRWLSEGRFRQLWASGMPWYFSGYTTEQMQVLARWVAHDYVAKVARPDSLARLRAHLAQGHLVALVSAAPQPIVTEIAQMWQVPHALGSPAEFRAGRYTGRVAGVPCVDEEKARYARAYFETQGLTLDWPNSYVYADSYADLGFFALVGRPVAVYPEAQLAELAKAKGWEVMGNVISE